MNPEPQDDPPAETVRPFRFGQFAPPGRKFPVRWFAGICLAGYLAADLHFFHGPLWHLMARLAGHQPPAAQEAPVFDIKVEAPADAPVR